MKRLTLVLISGLFALSSSFAQTTEVQGINTNLINRNWSLFFEYHKNKDYSSSIKYGMWLVKNAPDAKKTLWSKLNESFFNVSQDSTLSPEIKAAYFDSSMYILNLGIGFTPDKAKSFLVLKGYNYETYGNSPDSAIANYQAAIKMGFQDIDYRFVIRCGQLLAKKEQIGDAIDLYSMAKDFYDTNSLVEAAAAIVNELNGIASPEQIIEVNNKTLAIETDTAKSLKLRWQNFKLYLNQLKEDDKALAEILEILKLEQTSSAYRWAGQVNYNLGKYSDAIEMYQKALKLEETKEDFLNIAQCYINLDKGQSAREWANKALRVDKNLGRAHIVVGQAYEAAISSCVSQKGGWSKIEFEDRMVYLAVIDAYQRAKAVDPSVTGEANQRINAIHTNNLLPTKADYFFKKKKPGDKIKISGPCYSWIGETVTVPNF
ncbi:MAG: tetratricopeptide repeat protein [Bacteroidetes bacterium]|nr:tetratricopeptide repeat protein [Bacteroidota bacterium]